MVKLDDLIKKIQILIVEDSEIELKNKIQIKLSDLQNNKNYIDVDSILF
jgi:predicted ATP-dependent endonuclease of OLD family